MPIPTQPTNNNQPQNIIVEFQEMLVRRFGKMPKPAEQTLYEFTDDKALLHQYYILRERMLGTDKFLPKNVVPEDAYDKISHILIARRGKLCIGGARLTIREGDETFPLPMENDEFKLRDVFPHLPLDKVRHSVVSKFAILDNEKNHDILYTLCKILDKKVEDEGIQYNFVRATNIALARNWRLIFNTIRPNSARICKEIEVPDSPMFPGEKQYLVFSNLSGIPEYLSENGNASEFQKARKPMMTIAD